MMQNVEEKGLSMDETMFPHFATPLPAITSSLYPHRIILFGQFYPPFTLIHKSNQGFWVADEYLKHCKAKAHDRTE